LGLRTFELRAIELTIAMPGHLLVPLPYLGTIKGERKVSSVGAVLLDPKLFLTEKNTSTAVTGQFDKILGKNKKNLKQIKKLKI
jgi:hypothetical protein